MMVQDGFQGEEAQNPSAQEWVMAHPCPSGNVLFSVGKEQKEVIEPEGKDA